VQRRAVALQLEFSRVLAVSPDFLKLGEERTHLLFTESIVGRAYLICDNPLMFNIDYLAYNLVSVRTGVEAPNMNNIMERFCFEDSEKRGAGQVSVN